MTKILLPESMAYAMGHNCGQYGPTHVNSHFRLFATPELTAAWERGKADAEAK